MRYTFVLPYLFLALVSFSSLSYAAAAQNKEVPTDIQANHMEYSAEKQTVVFTGNIHVKRPDFELWSKKLTVYFKPSGKKTESEESGDAVSNMAAGDMDRIIAEGDVVMKSGEDKEGHCNKATYFTQTDVFLMEGSPRLRDKKTTIKGNTIKHYMATNRSEVLDRVHMTFSTSEKPNDKSQKTPGPAPKKPAPVKGKN